MGRFIGRFIEGSSKVHGKRDFDKQPLGAKMPKRLKMQTQITGASFHRSSKKQNHLLPNLEP